MLNTYKLTCPRCGKQQNFHADVKITKESYNTCVRCKQKNYFKLTSNGVKIITIESLHIFDNDNEFTIGEYGDNIGILYSDYANMIEDIEIIIDRPITAVEMMFLQDTLFPHLFSKKRSMIKAPALEPNVSEAA
jgi:DNA-directed RNA polymerase subunit RPC12/RpoP